MSGPRLVSEREEPATREYPLTDSGNAEAFAVEHDGRVVFDWSRRQWFFFDRHLWLQNTTAQVDRLALATVRRMQTQATKIQSDTRRKTSVKWALESENRARRDNLLTLAAKVAGVAVDGQQWDAAPDLLGVQNGVVVPTEGRLRDGVPGDWLTKRAPIHYAPQARCPRFERFMAEIFAGRPELVCYMQRVLGYALTGFTTEQVFWILFGHGANGKSTLIETCFHHIFGDRDYAWAMPFPSAGWSTNISEYQKAVLVGRRFVTASEVTRRGHLNEELVKSLTGDDTLNARHPYGRPFQFVPVAKFFLRVNDKPIIRDESHGMWRRVKLIEFNQTFRVDKTLSGILAGEAEGILAWIVRGCQEWAREGLCEPACVQAATAEYREESDPLSEFLTDRCVVDAAERIGGRELFAAYRHWCDDRQVKVDDRLSQKAFGLRIKDRFSDVGNARKAVYAGIGLQNVAGLDFHGDHDL